eukprot:13572041-Heterocapsa_arctica.AAC.1
MSKSNSSKISRSRSSRSSSISSSPSIEASMVIEASTVKGTRSNKDVSQDWDWSSLNALAKD